MEKTSITASNLRLRKSYAKNTDKINISSLIELQKKSDERVLRKYVDPDRRTEDGL